MGQTSVCVGRPIRDPVYIVHRCQYYRLWARNTTLLPRSRFFVIFSDFWLLQHLFMKGISLVVVFTLIYLDPSHLKSGIILVALCCTLSNKFVFLLEWTPCLNAIVQMRSYRRLVKLYHYLLGLIFDGSVDHA